MLRNQTRLNTNLLSLSLNPFYTCSITNRLFNISKAFLNMSRKSPRSLRETYTDRRFIPKNKHLRIALQIDIAIHERGIE